MSIVTPPASTTVSAANAAKAGEEAPSRLLGRMEALPLSSWHLKVRAIVGSATFFDGIDTVSIGLVLPVLGEAWHLSPQDIGWLISGGFAGQMIGAIGFGQLAERIGRIPTAMITTAIFALGGIGSAFTAGFTGMFVLRFLQGLGLGAEVPVAASYINEIAPAARRGRFVLLYEFIFVVGIVVAGFIGKAVIPQWGWQSIFLIGSIPPLFILILIRTLPESPRWLVRKGRIAEAERAVSEIEQKIRASGKIIPSTAPSVPSPAGDGTVSWAELFSPQYRARTLLIWMIWVAVGIISWPLQIWLPSIYKKIFHVSLEQALNFGLVNTIITLVATLSCALLIDLTGRRVWFTGALTLAGLTLVVLGLSGAGTLMWVVVCTSITLFAITSLNLAIYLYTPELYPTRLRTVGAGIAFAWARVAGMIAPPVIGWGMANNGLGSVFFGLGIVALIAALVTGFFAIETRRRILEEVSP